MVLVSKPAAATARTTDLSLLPAWPRNPSLGFLAAHFFNASLFYVCAKSAYEFEDSTRAMAFYGVYHREPWNQVIHFFGVPFILWTLLVGAAHLPWTKRVTLQGLPGVVPHHLSWAAAWALLYTAFYLSIDVTGALLFAPLLYTMYATSVNWAASDQATYCRLQQKRGSSGILKQLEPHWMGTGQLLRAAVVLHVLSWYLQIHLGHKIIEGAQPASLANLGGALTSAPLFAFNEGVWFLGFRKDFQNAVLDQVGIYTRQLCEQGAEMRVCATL
jgi:uncharacterized membrane protein YGL010W